MTDEKNTRSKVVFNEDDDGDDVEDDGFLGIPKDLPPSASRISE